MFKKLTAISLVFLIVFSLTTPLLAAPNPSFEKDEEIGYIVKFKDGSKGNTTLRTMSKKTEKAFSRLNAHAAVRLKKADLQKLQQDPNVEYVERDSYVQKSADLVTPNLTQIHVPAVTDSVYSSVYSGKGVKIAILDTGIAANHTDLRVTGGATFVPNETSYSDTNGHGTHVAGIIGALRNGQGLVGIAPEADLYAVKVLDVNGGGRYSWVIAGLEWAIDNHMDIVTLSFAGEEHSAALKEAMQLAAANGILLIAATGNDGKSSVSYPAKFSTAMAVGAVDGNNQVASFSNRGPEVELVAPGVNITGLSLTGSNAVASGTSASVAHVAGVAALLKQKAPTATAVSLRQTLKESTLTLGEKSVYGYGLVDAQQALSRPISTTPADHEPTNPNPSLPGPGQIVEDLSMRDFAQRLPIPDADGLVHVAAVGESSEEIKTNEAPFKLNMGNEIVSTLTGGLTLRETDLVLPGRNGQSFALTRVYDSNQAQYLKYAKNAVDAPTIDSKYRIGTGWFWDLPSLSRLINNYNVYIPGKGSFEYYDGFTILKGNPWNDVTVSTERDDSFGLITLTLHLLDGTQYLFNANHQLIKIMDAYQNTISFTYGGNGLLSKITGSAGSEIVITYHENSVVLTQGTKTVTYTTENRYVYENNETYMSKKKILTGVTDANNRQTTYAYQIKDPTWRNAPYPYALLNRVTYPTTATSEYTYDAEPVIRYYGKAQTGGYRVLAREDRMKNEQNVVEIKNKKTFHYVGDLNADADSTNTEFSMTIADDLTSTTFYNRRLWVWDEGLSYYPYTYRKVESGDGLIRTTDSTYDEVRKLPVPSSVSTKTKKTSTQLESDVSTVDYTYDIYGNKLTETNALRVTTEYGYDPTSHLLKSITQPVRAGLSLYKELTRNAKHTVTQEVIKENNAYGSVLQKTEYEIDGYGNPVQIKILDDGGRQNITQLEYSTDYNGAFPTKETQTVTDADGIPSTISRTFTYDPITGNLKTVKNGAGNTTIMDYDPLNRITRIQFADTLAKTATYNDLTNEMTVTDETGVTSKIRWNPLGERIEEGILDGTYQVKMKYGNDSYGRQIWSEDAASKRTQVTYDAWNRPIRTTYPDALQTVMSYDDIARTQTTVDPEGSGVKTTTDKLGRVEKKEEVKNGSLFPLERMEYGYLTTPLSHWDAKGNLTKYGYDALSRLKQVTQANNEVTSYAYTLAGMLKEVQYADGNKLIKQYDERGRMILKKDPLQQEEKLYYNGNDQLAKKVDRKGQVTQYAYNNRNRLITRTSPGETVGFDYDGAGRRTVMSDLTGTTRYNYKATTGELQKVTSPDGRYIAYEYDQLGLRKSMTDHFGYVSYYHYDNRNRLDVVGPTTDMNNYDAAYTYKGNNLLSRAKLRNGNKSEYAYDGLKLNTLLHKKADETVINSYSYGYDANGNMTSKVENGVPYSFGYDKLDRIETSSQYNESYTYNNRGNRATMQSDYAPIIENVDYSYDASDRLTQVAPAGNAAVTYRYNGDGQLYERTENGITTRYYYDSGNLIAEGNVSGGVASLKARYIRGNGLAARAAADGSQAYYLSNGHGDIVELRDATGNTRLNQYAYDIWGNQTLATEQVANPFRYSGEFWDNSTHLQYLRARWYDPSIGRFMNQDTYEGDISNPLSLNLYTYGHNNPLRYWDPSGHSVMSRAIGGMRAGVGAVGGPSSNPYTNPSSPISAASVSATRSDSSDHENFLNARMESEMQELTEMDRTRQNADSSVILSNWWEDEGALDKIDDQNNNDRLRGRDAKKREAKQIKDKFGDRTKREEQSKDLHKDKEGGSNDDNKSWNELDEYIDK
ncbi:S8 family serine peptidase [Paenibacillus periandrae]|uniref:S8 family serine peptidase n=1 Tax=Paenibacillus periandrae TaxID=1761741 RepID=UPI001F09CFBE|nr:S8 family serine peptidase [Paenibacillus periandrae]